MRISESRVRQIIEEEFRTLREADAHEEDLIHQAYHSGRSGSSGPEPVTDDPATDEPRDPDDEPFVTDDETPDEPPDADAEKEHVRKSLMRRFNDSKIVDFGLDILGTVGGYLAAGATAGSAGLGGPPAYVIAALPDLLNCVRNAARGDSFSAAIYFLCALPIIGEVLGPVKISIKLLGTAARAAEVFKIIDQIRKLVKGLKVIRTTRNVVRKIKEVCEKYFPDFDGDAVERDALIILNGSDDEVEDLLRRSGYLERERADDEVSTEASPLSESRKGRYVSIILESSKSSGSKSSKSSSSKSSSKKQDPLPPIPSTVEFEREMRGIISAYHAGEDIEAWLTHDILGSKASPHGLSRKTGWSGDEDFYRKPAASYIAQHLATNRDPELRAIGQRVLRKMGDRMGSRRFSSMGSGFGLEPIEDSD